MFVGVLEFRIIRRGREFWLEASDEDGSRCLIEPFDDADAAVQQMRHLQRLADRGSASVERYLKSALVRGREARK
jgi:hypothetical protein